MKKAAEFLAFMILICLVIAGCGHESDHGSDLKRGQSGAVGTILSAPPVTTVSSSRLLAAAGESHNWLTHGRTYDEQRFSPLDQINTSNVKELGLAWYFDIPTKRGIEATPIVVDGRMYVTGAWSMVYALDAADGSELWRYDPKVAREWARYACCDVVNRGVAVSGDSVFVGTLDGWLVSLEAATGKERWRVDTINRKPPYTITGAPRVVNTMVMIGNGGAEYGVRGYLSAYDAQSGELRWRFYTVPGNPKDGFASDALEMAASTWTGEWWKYGGGGTVWDSMAYDPELDLLYIGVGNGSPWNHKIRSPGGGDNLFLSSIVALRASDGAYVWHYQTTPGDSWDFTATQHIILAELEIKGRSRKVLMQAPKNGFFYVIDRVTGELISAEPYVKVNWASGIDEQTGRPLEAPNARYESEPFFIMPSPFGGHNWHPMSFSADSGLVYLPTQDIPFVHGEESGFEFTPGVWNTGTDFELVATPDDPEAIRELQKLVRGQLIAWDPVAQREVWRYQHMGPWNGGVLATAGGLVFQGSLIGEMAAYDAHNGQRLWQFPAQTGISAAPITYAVNDQQHVAIAVGWGGIFVMIGGEDTAALGQKNISRVLSFRLGAHGSLPVLEAPFVAAIPEPPESSANADIVALGKDLYFQVCFGCHGNGAVSGGLVPDLRRSSAGVHKIWNTIVLGGALKDAGMPEFDGVISAHGSDAIHAYVIERAQRAYTQQQSNER